MSHAKMSLHWSVIHYQMSFEWHIECSSEAPISTKSNVMAEAECLGLTCLINLMLYLTRIPNSPWATSRSPHEEHEHTNTKDNTGRHTIT